MNAALASPDLPKCRKTVIYNVGRFRQETRATLDRKIAFDIVVCKVAINPKKLEPLTFPNPRVFCNFQTLKELQMISRKSCTLKQLCYREQVEENAYRV